VQLTPAKPVEAAVQLPTHPNEPVHKKELFLISTAYRVKEVLHEWLDLLRAGAVITTVALQLSPLRSVLEIMQCRDVKRYDGYPYFTVLAGATQWCIYGSSAGYFSGDHTFFTMVEANGPGIFFGIFYVTQFFRWVPKGEARDTALQGYLRIGGLLLLTEVICLVLFRERVVFWFGLLGAIGSAQIALSPFKTLPEVLRTKSTRSWPLDLVTWSFIQSFATGSYGLGFGDMWVFVPNLIGVIAAGWQLILVALYSGPMGKIGAEKGLTLPGPYGTTAARSA